MTDEDKLEKLENLTQKFDADFHPNHPINREAARARNLTYDEKSEVYRDVSGCPTLDSFGQPLG